MAGLKCISTSDWHGGHPRLDQTLITANLRRELFPHLNDELDLLIISGDLTDTALDMSGVAAYEILAMMRDITALAYKHNFIVRVLQGTFTHDRNQNQHFKLFGDASDGRVKVIKQLDIETIPELGITLLYKPDDLPFKHVNEKIHIMLQECGVESVDIMVNHGYFEHMLPAGIPHIPANTLSKRDIDKYVHGFVISGHEHRPLVYKNIISNGSFDRLNHGSEEPKGFFTINYDTTSHKATYEQVINKSATMFTSIDIDAIRGDSDAVRTTVMQKVDDLMEKDTSTSQDKFIRLISDDTVVRLAIGQAIVAKYPNVQISTKNSTGKKPVSEAINYGQVEDLPKITSENIVDMVHEITMEAGEPLDTDYISKMLNYT